MSWVWNEFFFASNTPMPIVLWVCSTHSQPSSAKIGTESLRWRHIAYDLIQFNQHGSKFLSFHTILHYFQKPNANMNAKRFVHLFSFLSNAKRLRAFIIINEKWSAKNSLESNFHHNSFVVFDLRRNFFLKLTSIRRQFYLWNRQQYNFSKDDDERQLVWIRPIPCFCWIHTLHPLFCLCSRLPATSFDILEHSKLCHSCVLVWRIAVDFVVLLYLVWFGLMIPLSK